MNILHNPMYSLIIKVVWYIVLLLRHKTIQHIIVLHIVGNCNRYFLYLIVFEHRKSTTRIQQKPWKLVHLCRILLMSGACKTEVVDGLVSE